MSRTFDHLLLGGGTSCAYAAVALREHDKNATVAILGNESEPPYDRPPFTKYFLWNDEKTISDFHSKDETFYPENNVELILGQQAAAIDLANKRVRTDSGEEFGYGKLLYALGSEPLRPPIEGVDGAWVLRTCTDSAKIRDAAQKGAKAVVVGGGYIGAELASSLHGRGCEVTLIERGPRIWSAFPSEAIGVAVTKALKDMGVNVVTGSTVQSIQGGKTVKTDKGEFSGDFVAMGVGAKPRLDLARQAGLKMGEHGVLTNSQLQNVGDPNVWVSGDVLEYPDPHLGANYRIEHHLHAKGSAAHCGACMAGHLSDYKGVPYFFSDVGDLSMQLRGYPEKAAKSYLISNTDDPVVTEVYFFADGRIAGFADLRKDYKAQDPICELFERLIQARASAGPLEEEVVKPGFDLAKLETLV